MDAIALFAGEAALVITGTLIIVYATIAAIACAMRSSQISKERGE